MALKPKVVVITGASAGVGRSTARAFAREGAAVGDAGQVDAAAATFERELGPIDVWVNNAMTSVFAPLCETQLWLRTHVPNLANGTRNAGGHR
jgi:NAD(P)-dependent dehydrogenase (short-subunit alcohol dehydrogenase family)